jgi:hypothetical protein
MTEMHEYLAEQLARHESRIAGEEFSG